MYRTLDPSNGELVEEFATASDAEMQQALERAEEAFGDWRRRPLEERTALLERVAELLESKSEELGALMALEMGKPIQQGIGEAEKCAWVCRHYAESAEEMLAPRPHESDGSKAFVRFDPLGPIFAIMPWNFPFWQVFRHAAPGLAAGNVILLKHAPNTPRCALAIERLFAEAEVPTGVLQSLFLTNEQAAAAMRGSTVRGVTLTGSSRAGRSVASTAGESLKKTVLELGGSDPFVVFADADLVEAVKVGVTSRCLNSGQSCIAAKRFLVERSVFDRFRDGFVAAMEGQQVGDPQERSTEIGPLAREDLRSELDRQVRDSVEAGAEALCGGAVPDGDGFYYPPTVLVGVEPGMPAFEEELFGPVAVLAPFADEEEAVQLANDTEYGLGASLWTRDEERQSRLAERIEAGSLFFNGLVKSDPRLPFGGVKASGYGRELAREGMLEFTNIKTVWVA